MIVRIRTQEASEPIVYPNAIGTFQKRDFFCVFFKDREGRQVTHKYPIVSIFRVENDYPPTDHGEEHE